MKHKILVILLFGFLNSNLIKAQTSSSKYYTFEFNDLEIGNEVFNEAKKKQIKSDKAIITFIINLDCEAEKFKIQTAGKLDSFNLEIEKQAKKIMKKIQAKIKCDKEFSSIINVPIRIEFTP